MIRMEMGRDDPDDRLTAEGCGENPFPVSLVLLLPIPVSTMVQPASSSSSQILMWSSAKGRGIRTHRIPGATVTAVPASGMASLSCRAGWGSWRSIGRKALNWFRRGTIHRIPPGLYSLRPRQRQVLSMDANCRLQANRKCGELSSRSGSAIAAHAFQLIDSLDWCLSPGRNGEEAGQIAIHRRDVTFDRKTQAGMCRPG